MLECAREKFSFSRLVTIVSFGIYFTDVFGPGEVIFATCGHMMMKVEKSLVAGGDFSFWNLSDRDRNFLKFFIILLFFKLFSLLTFLHGIGRDRNKPR